MSAFKLVVGLDIGTTNTGIAFYNNGSHSTEVILDWPKAVGANAANEKVPTEIAYTLNGIRWGYDIPAGTSRHMWLKLDLEEHKSEKAKKMKNDRTLLFGQADNSSKNAETILSEYLKQVVQHFLKNLSRVYGQELWKSLEMVLVVTFPAVWSDSAKDKTLNAVSKAGFNPSDLPQLAKVLTVTEPEAAAIETLKAYHDTPVIKELLIDDGFVICDMGGGTVDLISYRVVATDPIKLEETTIGTGDQCGSSFIEREFIRWLEKKLGISNFLRISGNKLSSEVSYSSLPPSLEKLVRAFTKEKLAFDGQQETTIFLPRPLHTIDDPELDVEDGELTISKYDFMQMFQFSLNRTRDLIEEQIRQAGRSGRVNVKYIFLVGGFAMSEYVYCQLSALAKVYKMELLRPSSPWSAIVRGAVTKGLEDLHASVIQSRKCRRHYGVKSGNSFIPGVHDEKHAYNCVYTGKRRVHGMSWAIFKGQDLPTAPLGHGHVTLMGQFWPRDKKTQKFVLMACDADIAPKMSVDKDVYKVAELVIDLSTVPREHWYMKRNSKRKAYYEIYCELRISVESKLNFSVFIGDKEYGFVTSRYA